MTESRTRGRYRFVIIGLLLWANFAFGLSFIPIAPILPVLEDHYGISHTLAGLLVAIVFIVEAIFGLPGGIVVGRLGQRRSYTLSFFLMGAVTLTALSPGFGALVALRVAYSLGVALFFPATAPLIMQWFEPKILPIVYGVGTAAIMAGLMVSVATVAPLSDLLGWEKVLGIFGAVGLGVAVAWIFLGKTPDGVENVSAGPILVFTEIWAVMRNRTLFLIATADAAVFSMFFALTTWLPTFYHETRGWSLTEGGVVISLFPFVGIFAVIIGGYLPMKVASKRLFFIVPGVMVGLGSLGTFLIGDVTITYLSAIILGFGTYLFLPTAFTLPMGLPGMTPQRIALYWGWLLTTVGLGEFISPLVVGAIRDTWGTFVPGFLIFSLVGWWLFVAGFFLPKTGTQDAVLPIPAESTPLVQK